MEDSFFHSSVVQIANLPPIDIPVLHLPCSELVSFSVLEIGTSIVVSLDIICYRFEREKCKMSLAKTMLY